MSTLDRRDFLGSMLGFASVSAVAGTAALAQAATVTSASVLVLYRPGLGHSEEFAQAWAGAGFTTQALEADVVRQWRQNDGFQLGSRTQVLVGLGSWDDQVLLQGLAAEARRHPLLVMQHPLRLQHAGWAGAHAREVQALLQASAGQQGQALQALAQRSQLQAAAPALFSWVIG